MRNGTNIPLPNHIRMSQHIYRFAIVLILLIVLANPVQAGTQSNTTSGRNNYGIALPELPNNVFLPTVMVSDEVSWPMVAANPERTSWTPEEVSGNLHLEWYRPIEAYIPGNVQIIASNGMLYLSTARGLYVLNAATGELVWRFDTELPLGNSPTVAGGVVYVGGFDRKIHALDASNGTHLWSFDGAKAGFDTNPLVIQGKVIIGNRDGNMYAIGAHGTPNQGRLIWKYDVGAPIHLSAAYKNGILYFAANDNHAYALNASNGSLVWKSGKMPGDGYHSYWPVIYQDKVVFATATGYRAGANPGTGSVTDENGDGYGQVYYMDRDDIFAGAADGSFLGPVVPDQEWAHGYPVINASQITEYFENNPNPDPHKHKPWRRAFVVLNTNNGHEFTFDSDGDGYPEYIPIAMWGTQSGNRYPPLVGPDGVLYQGNIYQRQYITQGRVMGWKPNTPSLLSVLGGQGAVDEPQAISAGGNLIYRSIAVDRVGDWFNIMVPRRIRTLWSYDSPLYQQAPGYDVMYWDDNPDPDPIRFQVNYGTLNGIYDNGGVQTPIIPYQGRLFIHRSNAVIAYGTGPARGELPLLQINQAQDSLSTPTANDLRARLESEVQKIISAGHLRPGYYNTGQFSYKELMDYFNNPGDTLKVLSRAYPYLSASMQAQVRDYLGNFFNTYFDPTMVARIGWADGVAREALPLPPEVEAAIPGFESALGAGNGWSWQYPQHNFYAMWKYAQIFPGDAGRVYNLAKSKLEVPVSSFATNQYLGEKPWEHNAYIAGYIGFLNLQELAGKSTQDAALRTSVTNELNRLLQLRASNFSKDTPWIDDYWHRRHLNIARNFMMLTPELGSYLRANILSSVQEAMDEYQYVGPYWFVSRYEAVMDEGIMSNLYNYHALFQAQAFILNNSPQELTKYLDVPAFERGDLLYIDNLITAIEVYGANQLTSGCAAWGACTPPRVLARQGPFVVNIR